MTEWQPIETAIEDGRWMLGVWREWFTGGGHAYPQVVRAIDFGYFVEWKTVAGNGVQKPDFWTPLPEAPGPTKSNDLGQLIDEWTEEDTQLRNAMQALVGEFADEAARCTTANEAAVWALAKSMLEERLSAS